VVEATEVPPPIGSEEAAEAEAQEAEKNLNRLQENLGLKPKADLVDKLPNKPSNGAFAEVLPTPAALAKATVLQATDSDV